MSQYELELPLIEHQHQGELISQRAVDGYINATAMCKAAGKLFGHYSERLATKEFLQELSTDIGLPISEIVQVVKGGNSQIQGTWVHPQVAIHLAQWLSVKFAVQVTAWIFEWMSGGKNVSGQMPYHLKRYMVNRNQIPATHFSVLNEMIFGLIAPLESQGYTLPEHMMPDISEGMMFAKWVRETKNIDTKNLPTYSHSFEDGRIVQAKLYPNSLLADFRAHFHEVWMPQKALTYFKERDTAALPNLKLTLLPSIQPANDDIESVKDKAKK